MFRVIPILNMIDGGLVKTTAFRNARYIGDPINAVRIFNEKQVDEIVVLDIRASEANSGCDLDHAGAIASEAFMPLAYGGGISSIEEMGSLFQCGVEKVVVSTAAIRDITLISKAAERFGSQSVCVAMDFKKNRFGLGYKIREGSRFRRVAKVESEIARVFEAGAGEVFLTAVDREGTLSGIDKNLINHARIFNDMPIVYVGGTASIADMVEVDAAGFSGIGVGAFFVFNGPRNAVLISYKTPSSRQELQW